MLSTAAAVAILVAVATVAVTASGAPGRWQSAAAVARGAAQVAAVSLVLSRVVGHLGWVLLALAVMFLAAVATATQRIGWSGPQAARVALAMAAGAVTALTVVFTTGALAFTPRFVLAVGGIVIGNTMTVAALTGRRFGAAVHDRWEEVEGWLALGATPRQATRELARGTVAEALTPAVDQTKTTGLVTLPGAFVGAVFGGVSPLEAGRFQILVLAAIMAAGAVVAVVLVAESAAVQRRPPRIG